MKKYAISILIALCASLAPCEAQTNARRFVTVDETGANIQPGNFWSVNSPLIQGQLTNFPAGNISGVLPLSKGGTGASNSAGVIQSLGLGSAALSNASAFQSSSPVLSNLSLGIGTSLSNIPVSGVSGLQSALDSKLSTGATLSMTNINGLQAALNGKLNTNGTLPISNVVGLQTALDGKMPVNAGITNIFGLQTALNGKLDANGTLPIANVTGLQAALDSKLSSVGTLSIGNITGLQAALDGKLNPNSTLQISNVFGLQSVLDQKLGAGANLAISNVTGLQTALDGKLSTTASIPLGSVSGLQAVLDGKLGAGSTLAISNVSGLATALDGKLAVNGALPIANITGLQSALDQKFNTNGTLPVSSITGLQAVLDSKLDGSSTVQMSNVFGLQNALSSKLDATSPISILNVSGLQSALDGKLSTNGTLAIANIFGLQAALDSKLSSTNVSLQISNIAGLQTSLNSKLDVSSTLPISSITGLGDALAEKMPINQTFGIADIGGLQAVLSNKMDVSSTIPMYYISGLQDALDSKLSASNPVIPSISNVFGLTAALADKRSVTNSILISEVSNLEASLGSKLATNSSESLFPAFLQRTNGSFPLNNATGVLSLAYGGTGSTNSAGARVSILPSLTGNTGKVLGINSSGTDVEWVTTATISGLTVDLATTNAVGILPINKGGSGASTAAGARANLLPNLSGNANRILAVNSNGTDVVWSTNAGGGLTSVNLSSSEATGILPLSKGGTGGTNAFQARQNILPDTLGNENRVLTVATGGDLTWVAPADPTNSLEGDKITGVLPVSKGGTGATNTIGALAGLGLIDLQTNGSSTTAKLGNQAEVDGGGGIAVGAAAKAVSYGVSVGYYATGRGTYPFYTTNLNNGEVTTNNLGNTGNVAIGFDAKAGHQGVSLGNNSRTDDVTGGTALGTSSRAYANAVAVGSSAVATNSSVQIGSGTTSASNSIQVYNWGAVSSNKWANLANMTTVGSQVMTLVNGGPNQVLSMGPEGTNVVWTTPSAGGGSSLPDFMDHANKVLTVNPEENGVSWRPMSNAITDAGLMTNFPNYLLRTNGSISGLLPSYSNNALRVLTVNSNADNVEWSLGLPSLSNNPGMVLAVSSNGTSVEWTGVSNTVTDASALTNFPSYLLRTNGSAQGLLPAYAGNSNRVLALDSTGSNLVWVPDQMGGSNSTVNLSTTNAFGTLPVSKGGTGGTNTFAALGSTGLNIRVSAGGIQLGENATVTSGTYAAQGAALGRNATTQAGGAVGNNASSTGGGAVGGGASTGTGAAIGLSASAPGSAVAVGQNAVVSSTATNGIAIGTSANVSGIGAVQIGSGNNTASNTIQWQSMNVNTNEWNALATSTTHGRLLMAVPTNATHNQVLTWRTNGTPNGSVAWRDASLAGFPGTVTDVNVSGGTTGLTFSGGPVTNSGTITMSGTLARSNGGTGGATNWQQFATNFGVITNGTVNLSSSNSYGASHSGSVFVGPDVALYSGSAMSSATLVGASAKGRNSTVAIGNSAQGTTAGTAVGTVAVASGNTSVALGYYVSAGGFRAVGLGGSASGVRSIKIGSAADFETANSKDDTIQFYNNLPVRHEALTRAGMWFDSTGASNYGYTNTTVANMTPTTDSYGNPRMVSGVTTNITMVYSTAPSAFVFADSESAFTNQLGTNAVYTETFTNVPYTVAYSDFFGGNIYTNKLAYTNSTNGLSFAVYSARTNTSVQSFETTVEVTAWPTGSFSDAGNMQLDIDGTNVSSVGFYLYSRRQSFTEYVQHPLEVSINNGAMKTYFYPTNQQSYFAVTATVPITNITILNTAHRSSLRNITLSSFRRDADVPVQVTNTFEYINGILTKIRQP